MTTLEASRDELVLSVMPLVRHIAHAVARGNRLVDVDDLVSEGYIGALQAADSFEPDRGFTFGTFAAHRIRGAMRDYLRHLDHLSRRERAELPDDDPRRQLPARLDAPLGEHGGTLADLIADDSAFEEAVCDFDAARWAVGLLHGDEFEVIARHYWGDETLAAIGESLGFTESRACQVETSAMHAMRVAFIRAGLNPTTTIDAVRDTVRRRGRASTRDRDAMLADLNDLWGL